MNININIEDVVAEKLALKESELKDLLAVALYKYKGIHGSLAGKLAGKTEFEFHALLSDLGESVNYDVDDLIDDIKNNDL